MTRLNAARPAGDRARKAAETEGYRSKNTTAAALRAAVREGKIWRCLRCGSAPESFGLLAWFVPNDRQLQPAGYGVCEDCTPLVQGRYGATVKALALTQIEKRIEAGRAAS